MKLRLLRKRFRQRGILRILLTLLVCGGMLSLNVFLHTLSVEKNQYLDLTPEGLYTLSDAMMEEIGEIEAEITVTFCMDVDYLLSHEDTRYVYIMAKEIEKKMENVTVVHYDIEKNPTAVQKYKATSATKILPTDVIVSSGERYRILAAKTFWTYDSAGAHWAFNGEYRMATAFLSVASLKNPTAYMTVGHGETVYLPEGEEDPTHPGYAFYALLRDAGLQVKSLDLEKEDIPEDCVLLVLNGPTEDYTAGTADGVPSYMYVNKTSPVEKIDRYLDSFGSVMLFADPFVKLPELEELLAEWGMQRHNALVKDPRHALSTTEAAEEGRTSLIAFYADSTAHPVGYSLYKDIIDLSAPPKTIVKNAGYVSLAWDQEEKYDTSSSSALYSAVLLSSPEARAYDEDGLLCATDGNYHLASVTTRTYSEEVSRYYSYLFFGATTELTSAEYLQNGTYANYDILYSTVRTISRTDVYAADDLGSLSMNSANYGGKILQNTAMTETDRPIYENQKVIRTYYAMTPSLQKAWTVFVMLTPVLVIPALGFVVTSKRKYK